MFEYDNKHTIHSLSVGSITLPQCSHTTFATGKTVGSSHAVTVWGKPLYCHSLSTNSRQSENSSPSANEFCQPFLARPV